MMQIACLYLIYGLVGLIPEFSALYPKIDTHQDTYWDMAESQLPTLNQKILRFAQGKKGRKVGRGECWDLAEQAVNFAGARNSNDYRDVTDNDNYVWGEEVSLTEAMPGDIIQYRNFGGTMRKTQPNGSWQEVQFEAGHHTAILGRPLGKGAWRVYHQNSQGNRFVTLDTVHLKSTTYKKEENTVEVDVKGSYWIYRPKRK